jgi:hypothetical protein
MVQPLLKKIAYIPHDGSPGVDFPDMYWDPQTGDIYFGADGPINVHINGALANRMRAQMNNCGTQNLNGVDEGNPRPMPFAAGVSDNPPFVMIGPGVIQILLEGTYLLSYSLPFESDTGIILQGTSVGACWQWSMDGQNWSDLIQTKTFDTVHGVADDHGALTLSPVEQQLAAGTRLRVVGFQVGTYVDVYINSNDNQGGPFDWAWARIEAFRLVMGPPSQPPPPP